MNQGPGKESIKASSKVGGIWGRTRVAVKYGQGAAGLCSPLLQQAAVLEGGGHCTREPPAWVWGGLGQPLIHRHRPRGVLHDLQSTELPPTQRISGAAGCFSGCLTHKRASKPLRFQLWGCLPGIKSSPG